MKHSNTNVNFCRLMCMEVGVYSNGFAQMFLILCHKKSPGICKVHMGLGPSNADNLVG